jgi:flagellar protein FliS
MIKGAKAYFQTQVSTTTQGDLLIMLYDGAIKFLNQAKDKIEAKDYAQKGILISRAIDVIGELDGSLNGEKGGEVAKSLHQLYFYCNTRLLKANLEMDTSIVDEVIRILEGLRDAFRQIKDQAPAITPPGAGAATTQSASRMAAQPGGAPMASAARAAAAYGSAPAAQGADDRKEQPEPPKAPGLSAVPGPKAAPAPAPEANEPQDAPAPPPAQAPRPAPRLLRKPGLPGAYGNPGGSR